MTAPSEGWTGSLTVRRPDAGSARRLASVLRPESAREVPRSSAVLEAPLGDVVVLQVAAQDTGALRAALNAYLGWIQLAIGAESVALRSPKSGGSPSPGEALITAPPRRA